MPEQKELFFLCARENPHVVPIHIPYVASFDEYKKHFANAKPGQIKGEATPRYLSLYEETIKNAKRYFPNWRDIKIIILLRDPVERAFSHYTQDRRAGVENRAFVTAFENNLKLMKEDKWEKYRYPGLYYEQVKAYLNTFINVKIFLYDDLVKDRKKVCTEAYSFLGVDPTCMPQNIGKVYNEGKKIYRSVAWARTKYRTYLRKYISRSTFLASRYVFNRFFNTKKVRLDKKDKAILLPYFIDDIKKLETLLQRDLSAWYRT